MNNRELNLIRETSEKKGRRVLATGRTAGMRGFVVVEHEKTLYHQPRVALYIDGGEVDSMPGTMTETQAQGWADRIEARFESAARADPKNRIPFMR